MFRLVDFDGDGKSELFTACMDVADNSEKNIRIYTFYNGRFVQCKIDSNKPKIFDTSIVNSSKYKVVNPMTNEVTEYESHLSNDDIKKYGEKDCEQLNVTHQTDYLIRNGRPNIKKVLIIQDTYWQFDKDMVYGNGFSMYEYDNLAKNFKLVNCIYVNKKNPDIHSVFE